MKKYDVIIIGSGPGGEGASMKLSKEGKKVAVIEDFPEVGGFCTHYGTIPSKALRHYSMTISENELLTKTYPEILSNSTNIVREQVTLRQKFYLRNNVDVINGWAKFIDEHTIEVTKKNISIDILQADYFIIATGSSPYHPENIDFSHPRILDSNTILNFNGDPKIITIYGAGVVACEYATILKKFSKKINLVYSGNKLLNFLDDEIIDALSYHLRDIGVVIRPNEEIEKVEANDDCVKTYLKSNKIIESDILIYAQGRVGNTINMSLETIGIETNQRKNIVTNENYQTNIKHIYAVGDVIGFPGLASASYDQGRFAAEHIIYGVCNRVLIENIPSGIYTIPEISSVGKTERELTEEKVPYEIGHAYFKHLAKSQIMGNEVGILKILFHRETLEILGVHCFGPQAAEIIHIGQAILSQKGEANNIKYFVTTTFNYPTMAEAYRVAALNGLNRVGIH